MTKLSKKSFVEKPKKCSCLDTYAQLTTTDANNGKDKLTKRRTAKAITLAQVFPLIDLDSPLKKSYWRSFYCNNSMLQEGYKFTTTYCNGRWCTVCNRIRMAKMITAYSQPLMEIDDLYFVTLTAPNVKADKIKSEIVRMYKNWRNINQNLRKTYKLNIKGIRKLECTYNPRSDSYNLHFHFLIGGEVTAAKLIELWLSKNPDASPKAQDMRKAKDGSLIELFKYAVKGVHKGKYHAEALDNIYQAMYAKRTFQAFGINKIVSEDIDGIQSEDITFKGFRESDRWQWSNECKDWINQDGELLIETVLDGKLTDWIDKLTHGIDGEMVEDAQEQPTIKLSEDKKDDVLWSYYSEMADEVINSS